LLAVAELDLESLPTSVGASQDTLCPEGGPNSRTNSFLQRLAIPIVPSVSIVVAQQAIMG